jgi:hypothetical protein
MALFGSEYSEKCEKDLECIKLHTILMLFMLSYFCPCHVKKNSGLHTNRELHALLDVVTKTNKCTHMLCYIIIQWWGCNNDWCNFIFTWSLIVFYTSIWFYFSILINCYMQVLWWIHFCKLSLSTTTSLHCHTIPVIYGKSILYLISHRVKTCNGKSGLV